MVAAEPIEADMNRIKRERKPLFTLDEKLLWAARNWEIGIYTPLNDYRIR
jgi:hypothetical protein